jgi:hypothetical protein
MLRREMFIALLALGIAVGCSEVKKSDDDGEAGSSAAASGSGGSGGGGANAGSGGGSAAGEGGSGGTDAAGSGPAGEGGAGGSGANAGSGGGAAGDGGSGGTDAAGSGSAGEGGAGGTGPVDGIPCGQVICSLEECCSDPFSSTCGAPLPTGANTCLPPPPEGSESIEGCPTINIMNIFTIPSCCIDGQCGVDGTSFGFPGCTELGEAKADADAMGYGVFVMFPEPQACQ